VDAAFVADADRFVDGITAAAVGAIAGSMVIIAKQTVADVAVAAPNDTARARRAVESPCPVVSGRSGPGHDGTGSLDQAKFWFTKSQLTVFHHASTNFGRALR
jgi:hypothetical protein